MFLQQRVDGTRRLVTSASDLTAASACEFAFLRRVDVKLGREVDVPPDDDAMLARAAGLGDAHEQRVLDRYRAELGDSLVEIPRPETMSEADLAATARLTLDALRAGAGVVFQATFFDPAQRPASADEPEIGFVGFADFLRLAPDGAYEVQDAKLARRAKVTALMQLAAYAEQLDRLGIPVRDEAKLILGDGAVTTHRIADIAPVFRARRERLHRILLDRACERGGDGRIESAEPVAWGAPGIVACGRCEVCAPEIERTRDPLLVAGLRLSQRDRLLDAGITTIDELAAALPGIAEHRIAVAGIAQPVLERLARQASLQLAAVPGEAPPVALTDPAALSLIPEPSEGDLFFDFEGDLLYREPLPGSGARWGIDYLFGMVDPGERFTGLWAHDLEAERAALEEFLGMVSARRARYPDMHVYHYAAYERTHLLSIAARHGVGEDEVDRLLSEHVLVDLYPIVRKALLVGSRSYSIKKLEPLYMGSELRDEDGVTNAAQSVTEYAEASALLLESGAEDRAEGSRRLAAIEDYNRYDCVSTLRLRDWLRSLAPSAGLDPEERVFAESGEEPSTSRLGRRLSQFAEEAPDAESRSLAALAAGAVDYHRREQKSFWWSHYARLVDPVEDWADTRDVLVVDSGASRVESGWEIPDRGRTECRTVRLSGDAAPGSTFRPGSQVFALYDHPAPFRQAGSAPGSRGARLATVLEVHPDGVTITETLPRDTTPYRALPVAVAPGPPPRPGAQSGAIEEWGGKLLMSLERGGLPRDPVVDLLRRRPPRCADDALAVVDTATAENVRAGSEDGERAGASGFDAEAALLEAGVGSDGEPDTASAVVASLRRLDRSYLAVQGPPGTGKTYLAAHVIVQLVQRLGWHVGVVAQSHQVVENLLAATVDAGLDPARVAKAPRAGDRAADAPFTVLGRGGHAQFLRRNRDSGLGAVIGGTAWDFSNETRIGRRSLDLLVIDEAGQFSLAPTIAAAVSARRLLLLGDPQQLPQVSQGSHPVPVDTSALGWLLDERETMPSGLGFFLAETRRMQPALASVVSELAYEGRLRSHPSTADRFVTGIGPAGLHWDPVAHSGNSTSSAEEADEVVRLVRRALKGAVHEPDAEPRPLRPADLIVVAAYNAQVERVSEALAAAGLEEVRVGTVDRFQGQEAVVAILTLAASTPEDIPRGVEFLLMRNRLNVAISRAQWSAHLVSSTRLGDGLPRTAEGLAALSGYLRLVERGHADSRYC